MRTKAAMGKWMVAAAMAMSAACAGAGDELGAGADDLQARGLAGSARSHVATRAPAAGAEVPLRPAVTCGGVTPSALVQTSVNANVAVPSAIGWRYYLHSSPELHVAAHVKNLCGTHRGRSHFHAPAGRPFRLPECA